MVRESYIPNLVKSSTETAVESPSPLILGHPSLKERSRRQPLKDKLFTNIMYDYAQIIMNK